MSISRLSAVADYLAGRTEAALLALEAMPDAGPEGAALLALCQVRRVLSDYPPGMSADAPRWQAALAAAFDDPRLEADRAFARGWLHWLAGEWEPAEMQFAQVVSRHGAEPAGPAFAGAAYWLARVRVLLRRPEAVADFEQILRTVKDSSQATCWFVDLLWRAGHPDRAAQVWKAVRANRRVFAHDEGPLLEARALLRRGDFRRAERALAGCRPRGGVAQVERLLLLAWTLDAQNYREQAEALLRQAGAGPYPAAALQTWRDLFARRLAAPPPAAFAPYLRGQEARRDGRHGEAAAALREAQADPLARPFARYALACLGQDDFAAVLAGRPGWFLGVRCRARAALERFRGRQATPGELLDVLRQAEAAGYRPPGAEHYRRLALALGQRQPAVSDLQGLAEAPDEGNEVARRNRLRAALEVATRRLPARAALDLVLEWSQLDLVRADGDLGQAVGRQLLRLLLSEERASGLIPEARPVDTVLEQAAALLGPQPLLPLVRAWAEPGDAGNLVLDEDAPPLARLWHAARARGEGDRWQEQLLELKKHARLRAPAQALLLQVAARRGNAAAAARLLEDLDSWRGFSPGPPRFVLRAAARVLPATPSARWRDVLARWLQVWDALPSGPEAEPLVLHAGLALPCPAGTAAPAGTPPARWRLHQAALALHRDNSAEALAWVGAALKQGPTPEGPGDAVVRAALPELERLARAQALAEVARFHPDQAAVPPGLLADAADLLMAEPAGRFVLDHASRGDLFAARQGLAVLAAADDLAPRLAHHLALICYRAALFCEEADAALADACWRLAWPCWLRWAARADEPVRAAALGRLLEPHRRRVNDHLARAEVDRARRHWGYVQSLPGLARRLDAALAEQLGELTARFRDDLATDYLVTTREAMRYGDVPEGWRADYEKGLGGLRRLLSLDRDNVRLLTALVEVCGEWFLDCYNNNAAETLVEAVERYTPFALQLARLVEGRPGDLAARAALAEFCKFRGFVAPGRAARVALYREALRFNPANENVRTLLAEAEGE